MDCTWDKEVLGGLFNKTALEGVWDTHGRWIADERAGLKEKKKKQKNKKKREGGGGALAKNQPELENTAATMASRPKLVGASGWEATVHGFRFRLNREKEETVASPPMPSEWPEVSLCSTRHGRRPRSSTASMTRARWCSVFQGECTERERKRRQTQFGPKRGRGKPHAARAMADGHGARRSSTVGTEECPVSRVK